jgi:hypothetical protein
MKRWLTFAMLAVAAPWIVAQESRTWAPPPFTLEPYGFMQTVIVGAPHQESRALVIGNGVTALGLYVYDSQGHCIGLDDEESKVYDDRIVSWVPAAGGPYEVQIRNLGPGYNRAEAAAK